MLGPDFSRNDYNEALSRQLESYKHLQTQAQKIIRLILASFALIGALSSSRIVGFLLNLPISRESIRSEVRSEEVLQSLTDLNLIIIGSVVFVSLILLADAVVAAGRVLKTESLLPHLGETSVAYGSQPSVDSMDQYRHWIEKNGELLSKMRSDLDTVYVRIENAILVIVYSAGFLVAVSTNELLLTTVFNILLIMSIPTYIMAKIYYVMKSLYLNHNYSRLAEWKVAVSHGITFNKRTPPSIPASALIFAIYVYCSLLSLFTTYVLINVVSIPFLSS